jgi:hypothetical protein
LLTVSDLLREERDVAKGREKTAGFNGGGRSYVDCTDDSTEDCVEVYDLSHIAILCRYAVPKCAKRIKKKRKKSSK